MSSVYNNPFTPSFGETPLYLAGRKSVMQDLVRAFDAQTRHPSLTTCISGARGSGKTALITLAAQEAERRGWITANVTALPGMLEQLYEQTTLKASHIAPANGEQSRLTSLGIGQLVSLEWENPARLPGSWRLRMGSLIDELNACNTGVLFTIDELRPDLDEMVQLAATYQHFIREEKRVGLLMAGLPFNVSQLLQDRSVSFLRRAQGATLGRIEDFDIEDALVKTIAWSDRSIEKNALDLAVRAIEGFPFMMQLVGFRMWEQSPHMPVISLTDAQRGIELAQREMKERVLPSTYLELSKGDRKFLRAMLPDSGPSELANIASRLGRTSSYVSQYKRRLLEQGVIEERGRGFVRFALPMMRAFLEDYDE